MTEALDFQSIIMTLEEYWAGRGCLIWQPYHTEVGAGTMNPATSLRVLGPEPWNVGYVEPSIRPDDGRYGENPNRFYQHIQYQVILKPDPGNPQELYLKSLEALGIDPQVHDIRFVEDNWKSPALGAWGLGWEVWLNGLEITQYTYFQQAGGQPLDPVSVELTYGLERIAMALQQVRDFKNIRWNQQLSYGDVQLQSEQQFSKYAFELADVDTLREMFQLYEQEAERCLTEKQVLPAHDFVLKCSHTFNLLDTRGAVGVTERQAFFHRMRELSRRVAEAYLEEREALGFPWLEKEPGDVPYLGESYPAAEYPQVPAPFLLEIGTEELPHGDARSAVQQLNSLVPAMLADLRLNCQEAMILATPRRLVVYLKDLEPYQEDLEQLVKGPPEDRAYDADGNPTKAAQGFARSKGVAVEDLETREMDGGRYVAAVEKQEGRPAGEVLIEALPALIGSLKFEQSMRWNASNAAFSRPIRWLLALHGEYWLPFSFAGVQSGSCTRGLRFLEGGDIEVCSPEAYFQTLGQQGIILDQHRRGERIAEDLETLAEQTGGTVPPDPALLSEVTYLVEAPTALLGEFDPEYLELPREVLISVMKKHQRYFPVEKDGRLLPYFITVANKPSGAGEYPEQSVITQGNADVILARFADAAYFVHADRERSLEEFLPDLALLTFQVDLGSMLDKTRRVHTLVKKLAPMISLTGKDLEAAQRAAELCKADLATQMVVEMTSLQGVMGYYYALDSGESEAVARAIREHYLPASADDPAPETKAGLSVGIADRLDSLLGLFAAGLAPTGSKDPFALRRAALGLVGNLISWDLDFDLNAALEKTAEDLPVGVSQETHRETLEFIIDRLRHYLLDNGAAYDAVDAIISEQGHNPAGAYRALQDLEKWVQREDWELILDSYARCVRITRGLEKSYPLVEDLFEEGEEKALYQALKKAEAFERQTGDLQAFLTAFTPLIPYIKDFFDNVLVMAEEETLQENRLGLLQRIAALAEGTVDMSRLEGF